MLISYGLCNFLVRHTLALWLWLMLVEVSPSSLVMRFVAHTCLHLFRHGSCYAHTLGMEFYSSKRQLQPQAGTESEAQFSTVCIAIYSNYVNECTRKMPSEWRSPEQTYRISIRRCDNFSNYRTKYHIIHCSHTLGVLCRNFVLLISILKLAQLNNYLVFVVLHICEYDYYYLSDLT